MIMDRLYGGVCYAGIDTDPELKYPKGAGRVAFSNQQSYIAAISARFVQLQHNDIDKRVSEFTHFIHNIRPLKEKAASPPQLRFSQSFLMARCRAELCPSPLPCIGAFITAQPTITEGQARLCNHYGLWLPESRQMFRVADAYCRAALIIVVPYTCISTGAVLQPGYFRHAGQLQRDRS